MRKLIITEEEKKSILRLHRIVEQTTPPVSTTPPPATGPKPMFGTPEQRAAAKAKRQGQRKINFDNFIKGAYNKGFVETVDDGKFKSSCDITNNEEMSYLDNSSYKMPEIVYRELKDGRKVKINLKKYQRYIEQHKNDKDVPLDGLYTSKDIKNSDKSDTVDGPSFLSSINPFKEVSGCIYTDEDKSGVKK